MIQNILVDKKPLIGQQTTYKQASRDIKKDHSSLLDVNTLVDGKDFEAKAQDVAKIESSPRFDVMISPVIETMSPKSISDFQESSVSCPTLSRDNIA